ncbi:MAG: hypothetical protein LBQ84_09890 [Flavobacteriaceae bacterium]|jgi:hypothetical protein|nr:hypothetical protein [Flavobacteriaceae bacterium]
MKHFFILISLIATYSYAQVGIGTDNPDKSSVLDIVSTNKGILVPRVELTSTTMDLDQDGSRQAVGLLVYNIGTALLKGFYFWNGAEWRHLDNTTAIPPEIGGLLCEEASIEPQVFTKGTFYRGTMKVPYYGGNGGEYSMGTWLDSSFNTGLKARLKPGWLEYGSGYLVYDVEGTPSYDSPRGAYFYLSFGTTKVKTCIALVGEEVYADIKPRASLGPLQYTTDNNVQGYHRAITSPDGKFSVRVFVPSGTELSNSDIQIKSNTGPVTLMWNAAVAWTGASKGTGSNELLLPASGMWYGTSNETGANIKAVAVTDDKNAAWGDRDVYFVAPEQRQYIWTTTDVTDKTLYVCTFMMGAPTPNITASLATAMNTKVYLHIQQIRANE